MGKILKPSDLDKYPPKNFSGEWATYINGEFDGYAPMAMFQGCKVPVFLKPILEEMVADAAADGVTLTIAKGFVTLQDQIDIRRYYLRQEDKHRYNDIEWLLSAAVNAFRVLVGYPGSSNHQNIKRPAIDFNVTQTDKFGKRIGNLPSYKWLVENAHKYGFVRTIDSERWHWEYRPSVTDMFSEVEKTHPTWDGLV